MTDYKGIKIQTKHLKIIMKNLLKVKKMSKEGIYTFSFDKDAVLWNGQLACEWQSELNLDQIL